MMPAALGLSVFLLCALVILLVYRRARRAMHLPGPDPQMRYPACTRCGNSADSHEYFYGTCVTSAPTLAIKYSM